MVNKLVCLLKGHYTGVAKLRPGTIEGFGGFYMSSDKGDLKIVCLRCNKRLPVKDRKTKYV